MTQLPDKHRGIAMSTTFLTQFGTPDHLLGLWLLAMLLGIPAALAAIYKGSKNHPGFLGMNLAVFSALSPVILAWMSYQWADGDWTYFGTIWWFGLVLLCFLGCLAIAACWSKQS
ncbi:MAG: hypothetical protein AAGA25_12535 [Planctomycetota bacterium]